MTLEDNVEKEIVQVGQLALSISGRDEGNYFIVTKVVDDNFVLLVDGDVRRVDKPKKKKIKHLQLLPMVLFDLAEKFSQGKPVYDNEVRGVLTAVVSKINKGDVR